MVTVEIFSDVISPWCYIAKRRLESAVRQLKGLVSAEVRWLPFELNPQMPMEGMDRVAYRTAKFGSWQKAAELDAQVAAIGQSEGFALAFDRIERVPNTMDAHRLIGLAAQEGVQDAVVEALFRAYFIEGLDLAQRPVLLDVAASAGLDRTRAARLLESDEGKAEVRAQGARAQRLAIPGVPHFLVNGWFPLSYAWDAQTIAAALEGVQARSGSAPQVLRATREVAPVRTQYGFQRTRCGCDFCTAFCRHVPGPLDVADIPRLCPEGEDVFVWAEQHLQAITDKPFPHLVPARQANGHCHWLEDGKCVVHDNAPYGCAFFDAHMSADEIERRSRASNQAILEDMAVDGLYTQTWRHLRDRGLARPSADRAALNEEARRIRRSMEET